MDMVMYPVLFFLAYGGLFVGMPFIFGLPFVRPGRASYISVLGLMLAIELVFIVTSHMLERELANRVLHIVGGGILAFILYARVVYDTHVPLNRMQFFVLGFLVVTTLGVMNEHLEFFLQATGVRIFMWSMTDTWLDLASNSLGACIAGVPLALLRSRA